MPMDCSHVPPLLSRFVDAFVDHCVGGHVLGPPPPRGRSESPSPTFLPAADRLVAIGDIHGDVAKFREALRIAGLIDSKDGWTGGSTVLVQVGDQLDRGGSEISVLYLLEKLRLEAPRKGGGQVHVLQGNHETGNIDGWFSYATKEGFQDFDRWADWTRLGNRWKRMCHVADVPKDLLANVPPFISPESRARFAALQPGGEISSRLLAGNPAVLIIGSSVFVHGGLLPHHVDYGLERINKETREWISGEKGATVEKGKRQLWPPSKKQYTSPQFFRGSDALVWSRKYSEKRETDCDCELLSTTLEKIPGARRMVMGHTIQQPTGINVVCEGKAVRTDVGMSSGCYDAAPQVLEILNDRHLRVLSRHAPPRVLTSEDGQKRGFHEVLLESLRPRL